MSIVHDTREMSPSKMDQFRQEKPKCFRRRPSFGEVQYSFGHFGTATVCRQRHNYDEAKTSTFTVTLYFVNRIMRKCEDIVAKTHQQALKKAVDIKTKESDKDEIYT